MKISNIIYFPSYIFFIIWSISILLFSSIYNGIALETILYFLLFFIAMLIGNLFSFNLNLNCFPRITLIKSEYFLRKIIKFLLFLVIIYGIQMISFFSRFDSLTIALLEVRRAGLAGESIIPLYSLYIGIIQILFGLSIYGYILNVNNHHSAKLSTKLYIIGIVSSLIISLFDGSRSFFLSGFIWFMLTLVLTKRIKIKKLIYSFLIMLLLFSMTFSIFRSSIDNNLITGLEYTAIYISGAVGALEQVLNKEVTVYWQDFESISNKLSLLGLPVNKYDLTSLTMDYTYLDKDHQTNVYTSLGVYYQYFSYYTLFIGFIIGFFGGYLSKLSRKFNIAQFLYGLYLTAIFLSIFHEYFLSFIYLFIKLYIIIIIISTIEKISIMYFRQIKIFSLANK